MNLQRFETEHDEVLAAVSAAAAAERSAASGRGSAACRSAMRNMTDQEGIVRTYERAVLAVVLATVASLIVAIVMAFLGSRSGAIAGAIGTVVTGAAMSFVLKQRNDARKRLDALQRLRDKYCS
jgi:hypothetical protein